MTSFSINSFLFCITVVLVSSTPLLKDKGYKSKLMEIGVDEVIRLEVDDSGQCIFMKSEEGLYTFISPGGYQVCGLYLIAEPDFQIEIEFLNFRLSCTKGGTLNVMDGWELNGQLFPSPKDYSLSKGNRFAEFCGRKKPRKAMITSQNVALVAFRAPLRGDRFALNVRFRRNLKPCNAVVQQPSGIYTLRNFGRAINCTISIIFPQNIQFLAASVGFQSIRPERNMDMETSLIRKCKKRGSQDYIEIRGGDGLDTMEMAVADDFCGVSSVPKMEPMGVSCGNTAVRLVSSGEFENSVTFSYDIPMDFSKANLVCPSAGRTL